MLNPQRQEQVLALCRALVQQSSYSGEESGVEPRRHRRKIAQHIYCDKHNARRHHESDKTFISEL